ncbi:hypothetical protein GGX14DRAFT_567764 [Mycena pura]|uniref:Uncharacterized protein n=1 Tax=Mycena pura TaxID=153505 RepID=A0AAD6VHH5_9AGAR|nr:hypothetical protein GGX14DRAFT_567764 [Mycena pura]
MLPADRVRRLWHGFEQWVATVPRLAMEENIADKFREMDAEWTATPTRTRLPKPDHEKNKLKYRRDLEDGLVIFAREEWQRRLEEAGLRDEDWGEMTFKETLAVERLLGGDLDEEGMAIMESVARADDPDDLHSLSASKDTLRTSNFSDYSFVSPRSLVLDDELEDNFESILSHELVSSVPESVADEIFDTPASMLWGWSGNSSPNGIWSASTSQSSRQSSQTGSPERPPKSIPAQDTFFPRMSETPSQFAPETRTRISGPRYIGPQLTDHDEAEDEAEFESFKMDTRVAKIREFHAEAAAADIQLAHDIYNARQVSVSTTWRADEARRISEHEQRMLELRRAKEYERKEIVRAERHKRRQEIRLRQQLRSTPTGPGGAESLRQRLTQEVESKLRAGGGFFGTQEPIMAETGTTKDKELVELQLHAADAQRVAEKTKQQRKMKDARVEQETARKREAELLRQREETELTERDTDHRRREVQNKPWAEKRKRSSVDLGDSWASVFSSPATANTAPIPSPLAPIEPNQYAPEISDLLDVLTPTVPSTTCSTPVSITSVSVVSSSVSSSSASSRKSAARPPVWLPSTDCAKDDTQAPMTPTVKKKVVPPRAGASAKAQAALAQRPIETDKETFPTPVDTPKPALANVSKPTPPVVNKPVQPPVVSKLAPTATKRIPTIVPKLPEPGVSKVTQPVVSKPTPPFGPKFTSTVVPKPAQHKPVFKPTEPVTSKPAQSGSKATQPIVSGSTQPVTSSSTVSQKKAHSHAMELETPGASSSRTTLEQMHRPLLHKSLSVSNPWMAPPPVPSGREVWVTSSAAAKMAGTGKSKTSTGSAQIEKLASISLPHHSALAEDVRPQRMSDPTPSFELPDNVGSKADALSSMLTDPQIKGKPGKAQRVTVEEVSDDEDANTKEHLPVDSRYIFEPKPSVPQAMFSNIIDFSPPALSDGVSQPGGPADGFLAADGKSVKEKHVSRTQSTAGASPAGTRTAENPGVRAALEALETNVLSPPNAGAGKKARPRGGSLMQPSRTDRKGKGKIKATETETEDDIARFIMGATQDLTQMRG